MSPKLRAVAERVLPEPVRGRAGPALGRTMDRLGVPPPGLRAGRQQPASGTSGWPAVVVLLLGAQGQPAVAVTTVAATAEALLPAAAAARVRPVLVLDTSHFAAVRRAGLAVEHVLPLDEWDRRHPGTPYTGYLGERLEQLRQDYATGHLVTLPSGGAGALPDGELAALLVPPYRNPLRRWWQRLAGRLEGAIDRPSSGA
jgi:hypothetical protein